VTKPDGEIRGRIALDYDPSRAKPNTWCQTESFDGIFVRFHEAASKEFTGVFAVRYRKVNPGALFIRPLDADLTAWVSESVVVHEGFARVSFILGGCPEVIARGVFCES
jgi:hypothetical protein